MPGGMRFNPEGSSEHVTEIERLILVTKEIIRSIRHSLPFNKIHKLFMIHLVFQAIKMLNHFPVKGGIFDTISPTTIISSKSLHYKKYLSLQILQYCLLY